MKRTLAGRGRARVAPLAVGRPPRPPARLVRRRGRPSDPPGSARLLAADLRTAGPRFAVEVVPEEGPNTPQREVAAALGLRIPEALPWSIAVLYDDQKQMRLIFNGEQEFSAQLAEALDHVQDLVAEATTEQWPPCPGHRHAMEPIPNQDLVGWRCPSSRQVLAAIGQLAR